MVNRVFNFYDTVAFSQWSYHFHQSKMRSKMVWASYKHALKDFIRGYTSDQEYYSAKLKVQSVSNNWGFEHGMDNNYNLLRWLLTVFLCSCIYIFVQVGQILNIKKENVEKSKKEAETKVGNILKKFTNIFGKS